MSQSQGSALLGRVPGMVYQCAADAERTAISVSPGSDALTGYLPAEFEGGRRLTLAQLVHPEDRAQVTLALADARRQRTPYRLTYRIVTSTGEEKWVLDQGQAVDGTDEGFLFDVTEYRQMQHKLDQRTGLLQLQQVIAAAANESHSIEEALQSGLDLVCAYAGWPVGHVFLRQENNGRELVSLDLWHLEDNGRFARFKAATESMRVVPSTGLPGRVVANGSPAWIMDISADCDCPRGKVALETGLVAAFAFPVWIGKEIEAVMEFFVDRPTAPNPALLAVLQHVGTQLGRVIERHRAAGILQQRERRFRAVIENISGCILILDATGAITYASPSVERMLGYRPDELLGRAKFDFVHPDDLAAVTATFERGVRIPGFMETLNYRIRHRDGSWRHWESFGKNLLDDEVVAGVIISARDLTIRKKFEDQLELQSSALAAAANGIAIVDRTGTILWVNPAFSRLTGYSAAELVGQSTRLLRSGKHCPEFYSNLWNTILAGSVWHGEIVNRRKDGTLYTEEMTITPVRNGGNAITRFIAIKQDITHRKAAEDALREANAHLERALADLRTAQQQSIQQERLHALGTMASGIAHDFNNALASILGFSELLLMRPTSLDDKEKARNYLNIIHTAAGDAANVVRRLRSFYRPRADEDDFESIALNRLVEEAVILTEPKWKVQAEARGVAVSVQTDLATVPPLPGSPADVREALTNLILNAVDAMPAGGTITLRTRHDTGHVTLEVADTGTGMTEEVRRRCLEPFFSTKGAAGTGLGLSGVYGMVQRHNGTIDIDTAEGRGTKFTIRLPVTAEHKPHIDTGVVPGAVRPMRALLVDDDPYVRAVLIEFMTGDGHTVVPAASGDEALEKFQAEPFDLVVIDRAMPGMSGDHLAVAIKKLAPTHPIIMLTGFGAMMQAAREVPPGVDFVVSKPVTIQQLREAVARVATTTGPV